ncbi:methyl-accepting chemotaxis protein [Shewanella sp. VB17]|uniref:methyl-accepting chemotaxis protein n=1 Tax=Shewanella sp. VB17 TaxID=2739432 RepID=UPI001562FBD4|nr:methyl-accepting chemotaxis protein [Shewanella sp. VB17]NRD75546.1 methyl-accepting chemotaxis protein [Shewanella sp. VB17]
MTLRFRMTLVSIVSTLLVALSLAFINYMSQAQIEQRFKSAINTGQAVLWKKIVASNVDSMSTGSSGLTRDSATRKAIKKGNIKSLQENVNTTYNLLQAQHILTKLQITDLDANILASLPNVQTGNTQKQLVKDAIEEGKIKGGVEVDDNGDLIISFSFPLYMRGKTIGAAIFGKSLNDALDDFKRNINADVAVYNTAGDSIYSSDATLFKDIDLVRPLLTESDVIVLKHNGIVYSVAMQPIYDAFNKPVAQIVSMKDYTQSYEAQKQFEFVSYFSVFIVICSAVIALYFYMNHSLKPLENLVVSLNHIALGQLSEDIDITSNDELGQLQQAMQAMVVQLRSMMQEINGVTNMLYKSAHEMAEITDEAQKSTLKQQAETDIVAAAMNEMTSNVQNVAENATNAAKAAIDANSETNSGREVVSGTILLINDLASEIAKAANVVNRLEEASNDIGSVLDVIKSIAEQTNLLALNAAIEAARAGEQGRGFAVVADEVRTLASRTQNSTQEINNMIETFRQHVSEAVTVMKKSQDQASMSVEKVTKAGTSLDLISSSITTINEMNVNIANSTEEQSVVTKEVNSNIMNITDYAHHAATAAKSINEACGELNQLANDLQDRISHFKL